MGGQGRGRSSSLVRAVVALVLVGSCLTWRPAAPPAAAATVPSGFSDVVTISGLTQPTAVAFAADGRVFVADKSGVIRVYDSLSDPTPTTFADLRTQVHNYWDRGMLGLALHPDFPTHPYVYVLYAYDAMPGGTAPRWGSPGVTSDSCPNPPGATAGGCVIQARLSRLTADGDHMTGPEQPLVTGWCQQFPSHSAGAVMFGPDGYLYASAGEGANFGYADYGQAGNPCGDPPQAAGTGLTLPTADGGALRSQSARRSAGQAVVLSGSIVRVDPDTGAGAPGNPFAASADQNARRIIAYGMRNPFRFTMRPGTEQLWVGDVGWKTWEEINRVADINDGVAENFGWPCYEGAGRQPAYDAVNVNRCESLYSGGSQTAPYYTYNHASKVVATDACASGSSSTTGLAFESGSNYPTAYRNALFFADSSRGCIWVMRPGANGSPDPAQITPFVSGADQVVQLLIGPGGDLFYLNLTRGELHRVVYNGANHPPTASFTADPVNGAPPLTVSFDGRASSDLDAGDALTYAWDLDGDGAFDDATGPTASFTYGANGTIATRLRVTDRAGASDTQSVTVVVGPPNQPPVPVIDAPGNGGLWRVGDEIAYSGHATDPEDGTLTASRLSWSVVLNHCPSNCHTHPLQDFVGQANGSFPAPDHDYPTTLSLVLTATDSSGAKASTSIELDPEPVRLTFASSPTGMRLGVGAEAITAPASRTVIVGSSNSLSAALGQVLGGTLYSFQSWSDGGPATHNVSAPSTATTYTASYQRVQAGCPTTPSFAYTIPVPTGTPAAVPLGDGQIVFTTRGADGRHYMVANDIGTTPLASGPLECYSGGSVQSPAVAAGSSFVALFGRSADNRLWERTITAGDTGSWSLLPTGGSTDRPAAVVASDGVVHLVVRATNGSVYHATRRGTMWSPWESLGGGIVGPPAVAPGPNGGIVIVVRGAANGIYVMEGNTGSWSGWSRFATGQTPGAPTIAWGFAPGRLDVFVTGTSGGMYQAARVNGAWTGWSRRGGTVPAGANLAAAADTGNIVVYVGTSNGISYQHYVAGTGWLPGGTPGYVCPICLPGARSNGIFE